MVPRSLASELSSSHSKARGTRDFFPLVFPSASCSYNMHNSSILLVSSACPTFNSILLLSSTLWSLTSYIHSGLPRLGRSGKGHSRDVCTSISIPYRQKQFRSATVTHFTRSAQRPPISLSTFPVHPSGPLWEEWSHLHSSWAAGGP